MTGRDSLEFTAASKELSGDIQDRISLSAVVNGKKEEAVTVRSAEAKDGKAVVTFDEVEAAEKVRSSYWSALMRTIGLLHTALRILQ